MELSSLTLFVTNACNFDCVYCYQKKGRNTIEHRTLERALDFFLPFLTRYPHINFYGGEPLLAFDRIVQAVHYCESQANRSRRRFRYSITTNGSLVDDEVLGFLR
ncbi:MAG: radical SAM protein, partial [Candidatus Aminicenantales bacterium]